MRQVGRRGGQKAELAGCTEGPPARTESPRRSAAPAIWVPSSPHCCPLPGGDERTRRPTARSPVHLGLNCPRAPWLQDRGSAVVLSGRCLAGRPAVAQ